MPVQMAQAQEIIDVLANETLPVVLVGDFNSAADGSTTPTYDMLLAAGYVDAWDDAPSADSGLTCCQRGDLLNEESELSERIDLVLVRDGFDLDGPGIVGGVHVDVVGEEAGDRTESGLWPSDHAGVVATLRLAATRAAAP